MNISFGKANKMATTTKSAAMSIEQQVKEAIEEFGELAHERFVVAGIGFVDCKSNDDLTNPEFFIQLKTPQELITHDVKVYGDDAYLIWEWQYKDNGCPTWKNNWSNCDRQLSFKSTLSYRRKTSAALPFDLERAKAGDVVEIHANYWKNCKSKTFEKIKFPLVQLDNISVSEFNLRMKYPKKINR